MTNANNLLIVLWALVFCGAFGAASAADVLDHSAPVIDANLITQIKHRTTLWAPAQFPKPFINRKKDCRLPRRLPPLRWFHSLSGTIGDVQTMLISFGDPRPRPTQERREEIIVEEHFDAREKWPACINGIANQGNCSSGWAIAVAQSLSDRLCIASSGSVIVPLSAQFLVSCDRTSRGCRGGMQDNAWYFLENKGAPSERCVPYVHTGHDTGALTRLTYMCRTDTCRRPRKNAHRCAPMERRSAKYIVSNMGPSQPQQRCRPSRLRS